MAARLGSLTAALVPALGLACAATFTVAPGSAEADTAGRTSAQHADRQRVPQTSDGVRGERARPLPDAFRVQDTWTTLQTYPVAPGVSSEQFTLTGARKTLRGQLVRIDPATPGLGFDLVAGKHVASRHLVADVMDPTAVVGVNGDFFDIRDTDAPLGVAKDQQRGVLNGVQSGWNSAFWVDPTGVPHIGDLYADAVIRQRPRIDVTTVNSPSVRPRQIGLYTKDWGTLQGYRVVDGKRRDVRMVVVRHERVVATKEKFPDTKKVRGGVVLVGRGAGADRLARLRVGQKVTTDVTLSQDVAMAITGNMFILRDGVRISKDDRDLHPRTAIGIDRDTGQLLLVVMDGRSEISRGATMLEMAKLFERLGAEDALNLDGGGSSIMLLRQADGSLAVANTPSDGQPRPVANGLEITYQAPAAAPPSSSARSTRVTETAPSAR
ncbi:MAG TPA: phosphodiester glycosidase family protein [Nocardioides sp.]|uniref:phosphodiester glycosidase family protein n=1 Tax=uncultured Nocardioides sp. TaxID=198441 RepID=UPI000ED71F61|nr:phosphodiester glycosidase family protein [uncultured Nocardioides sp.]HCB03768.1 hypothetical protein [Nocardioides sp.]HRD60048.1 phosphodiester glycosidase family protein [Nocardioides sp.]HRI95186.1 phosphodiester glycosidase family protein [Nocardioides sp.]HRK47812.1 phosphodiester glycosidase family protein [Nocardioides sp.]